MHARLAVLLVLTSAAFSSADWPFPREDGTVWRYTLSREPGANPATLTRRINQPDRSDGEQLLRLETIIDGVAAATELLRDTPQGVMAEIPQGDELRQVTVVPGSLEQGASWSFGGEMAGLRVDLPLTLLEEQDIQVPAGTFRASHIHGEQHGSVWTTADEWFVRDVGSVKEIVTQRAPTGELLARNTLELLALPAKETAAPTKSDAKSFEASVSTSTAGEPMETIPADALQIVARWRVRTPAGNTKLRAVWIAEDVGDVTSHNYKIDEATAVATPPQTVGSFTLERPEDGWAVGKYRVELYLGNVLAQTLRLTIGGGSETAKEGLY